MNADSTMTTGSPRRPRGPLGLIALVLKGAWLAVTRTALLFVTILFLVLVGAVFNAIGSANKPLEIAEGSALRLPLTGVVVEREETPDPFDEIFGEEVFELGLRDIETALDAAAGDDRIGGLVVELGGAVGITSARAIADKIRDFKSSGKPVYAYGVAMSQADLIVAAAADDVVLHKDGVALLTGYSFKPLYYASLLEKLKVDVNVFRVGTYKAAVEPYLLDAMSEAAAENYRELGEGLFGAVLADVAQGRNLSEDDLTALVREGPDRLVAEGGDFADLAVSAGLVDRASTLVEIREELEERFGAESGEKDPTYNAVRADDYAEEVRRARGEKKGDAVGVVYVVGSIAGGSDEPGVAGSASITRNLRRAAADPRVKAVVLRVDSPGGSSLASEFIRNELMEIQETGKPVIVSMGRRAASGGYWISAPADEIWAAPTTITGSIGIFAVLPNFARAGEEIGVNADGVAYAEWTDFANPLEPLSDGGRAALQASIEDGYRDFLDVVSSGRDMTTERVDDIGQGRVWLGAKALELGLVDRMGGFEDAVAAAAARAGVEDYVVRVFEDEPTPFEQFVSSFTSALAPKIVAAVGLDPALVKRFRAETAPLSRAVPEPSFDPRGHVALCTACLNDDL